MKTYRARIEIRNHGAIGIFQWVIRDQEAHDIDTARKIIFDELHKDYETRGFAIRELVDVNTLTDDHVQEEFKERIRDKFIYNQR